MVDISSLNKYIEIPDNFMIDYIPHEIKRLGLDRFLDLSISSLDSSKVWPDGLRPIQTISYIYVRAITEIIYTINTYVKEENRDEWFVKLLTRHNANIEYEKEHPPVDYDVDKPKAKSKSGTTKQSTPRKRKKDEPTAAELKLAARVAKINALKINLKH